MFKIWYDHYKGQESIDNDLQKYINIKNEKSFKM